MKTEANFYVEITKESGEVIDRESFTDEAAAHRRFEEIEKLRYPSTYKNLTMNLSEFYDSGMLGTVRVVVETPKEIFTRREMYRKA